MQLSKNFLAVLQAFLFSGEHFLTFSAHTYCVTASVKVDSIPLETEKHRHLRWARISAGYSDSALVPAFRRALSDFPHINIPCDSFRTYQLHSAVN